MRMWQRLVFSVGEYVKALECSKAYLMFHPDDEDVLDNVDYYESLLDNSIDPASIEAREVRAECGEKSLHSGGFQGELIKNQQTDVIVNNNNKTHRDLVAVPDLNSFQCLPCQKWRVS